MQSNIDTVWDDLIEFPDSWIELYNDEEYDINIKGWYISISSDYQEGWQFSDSFIVPAKGYKLIYCDKVGKKDHANFRLENGNGGSIYLFNSTGEIVDSLINIGKQPAPNISYGRIGDGKERWGYFIYSTPLAPNEGEISNQLPPTPIFSIQGGIYKNAMTLSLTLPSGIPEPTSQYPIHYTLDGSEPTKNSLTYTTPILISNSTVVKAKIIAPGYLIGRSISNSYIITNRELTLPVISISMNPEYLWDEYSGIYVEGNGKNGISGNCQTFLANYNNDWRRPMNIEYFVDNKKVLNQLGEIRISGGCTRHNAQKSFILYAHKRFGEKRFYYPFFHAKGNQEIKSFMLRNSGNDFGYTHFRDAVVQLFMGDKADIDYQAYQPAIVYINGEYFGIQNIRERSQEDFIYANYDGLEDVDVIENWNTAKTGDMGDFNQLMAKLKLSDNEIPYEEIINKIDITEFINYYILRMYSASADFPHNNVIMWKPKTEAGKWRFILKDLDYTTGLLRHIRPDGDLFPLYLNDEYYSLLFKTLMKNERVKKEFYTRFAIYLGDFLRYEHLSHLIDSITNILNYEMPFHIEKWEKDIPCNTIGSWNEEIEYIKDWCRKRKDVLYSQISLHLKVEKSIPVNVTVLNENIPFISLFINNIKLSTPFFSGKYFQGETFNLKWESNEEIDITGWKIDIISNNYKNTIKKWAMN